MRNVLPYCASMDAGTLCRLFLGAGGSWDQLAGPLSAGAGLPRLLCSGDLDQFASMAQLRSAVRQAQQAEERAAMRTGVAAATTASPSATGSGDAVPRGIGGGGGAVAAPAAATEPPATSPSLELVLWPGCDHFFIECREPRALVASGLLEQPYGAAPGRGAADGGGGGRGGRSEGATSGYSNSSLASSGSREAGGQLQPDVSHPWKALASFVVGWLLSRAQTRATERVQ
jgi:hypothetical protein